MTILEIDLTWSPPSGNITMRGSEPWLDGVGFAAYPLEFRFTGLPPDGLWVIQFVGGIPKLDVNGNAILGDYDIHTALLSDPGWGIWQRPADSGYLGMQAVPEPSTVWLLAAALLACAVWRKLCPR